MRLEKAHPLDTRTIAFRYTFIRVGRNPISKSDTLIEKGNSLVIPDVSHPAWARFVAGKMAVQSSKATFNLLVHSNKMNYERDSSAANVKLLVAKSHEFLTKFQSIFANEAEAIFK